MMDRGASLAWGKRNEDMGLIVRRGGVGGRRVFADADKSFEAGKHEREMLADRFERGISRPRRHGLQRGLVVRGEIIAGLAWIPR